MFYLCTILIAMKQLINYKINIMKLDFFTVTENGTITIDGQVVHKAGNNKNNLSMSMYQIEAIIKAAHTLYINDILSEEGLYSLETLQEIYGN